MNSLDGKVAMITGAASKRGMGHAIALKFAKEGADVVITDKFAAPKSLFPGDEKWGGLDEIVSEIEALETLFNCDAYHVASGGVGGAEGSISLLVDSFEIEEEMDKINDFMEKIAEEPIYQPNLD